MLEVRNLKFQRGFPPISFPIDFEVNAGELCAIYGPRGVGKRQLLSTIAGLQSPSEGEIRFNGKSISGKKISELKRLGIVCDLYEPSLLARLSDSIKEPTLIKRLRRASGGKSNIENVIGLFGLNGLENRSFKECSSGQRYRCRLAELWVSEPSLVILNEPFNYFDSATVDQFVEILGNIGKHTNTGILLASRSFDFLDFLDRIYRLDLDRFEQVEDEADNLQADEKPNSIDVFISYSRKDSATAYAIDDYLGHQKLRTWIDKRNIKAGSRWDAEIEEAVSTSRVVIVLLSKSSVKSDNVLDEISYALSKRIPMIPVMIENCELPLRLQRVQYTEIKGNDFSPIGTAIAAALGSQCKDDT